MFLTHNVAGRAPDFDDVTCEGVIFASPTTHQSVNCNLEAAGFYLSLCFYFSFPTLVLSVFNLLPAA